VSQQQKRLTASGEYALLTMLDGPRVFARDTATGKHLLALALARPTGQRHRALALTAEGHRLARKLAGIGAGE
jgi:hypothetical protein